MFKPFSAIRVVSLLTLSIVASFSVQAKTWSVDTQSEYKNAVKSVEPGDEIVLANGTWQDFEILFKAKGEKDSPITLKAETKGKVILSGNSNLRLAGEHLVVSGLVFKDGFSPTGEVISFRRNKSDLASHTRVTEVVIDHFSNPDKFESDKWIVMYGKHNRVDHSHIEGKSNSGVTMTVRLTTKESQENFHRIDHNYFGPRPILGSNGGETLRIGTSHYSLSDSNTLVENNYFDRCDGEVEIVSNKSGANIFRNNTFFESRGTLTLRHGNGNLVENNVFFGNGVDHTGGIRVINADQVIRNNYLEGLTGYRFGSGLTIMNGVPNSTINRYHQVKNARIENNTLINVDNLQFAAGSDSERSAAPINSKVTDNIIFNDNVENTISIFDDISGIMFKGNVIDQANDSGIKHGMKKSHVALKRAENGLMYPTDNKLADKGISKSIKVTQKSDVGVAWYPKSGPVVEFASGNTIAVKANADAFYDALAIAEDGDQLLLAPGVYELNRIVTLDKVVSIKAVKKGKTTISIMRSTGFDILEHGSLQLVDLMFTGKDAPDNAGNVLVRTSKLPTLANYRFEMLGSSVDNLTINHSYHFFDAGNRSFADSIVIKDSTFNNITGDILRLNKETDDLGIYNAEYVTLENNKFTNIEGGIIKLYRGGTDESTFGPHLMMNKNVIENVGHGKRNKEKAVAYVHGVQVTDIVNNEFTNTAKVLINHTVGEPITLVDENQFNGVEKLSITELNFPDKPTGVISNNLYKKINSID